MALFERRALIIEPHVDFRQTLHDLFDLRGWFVMSTPRGLDASTIASGLTPQIVLFDMQLLDLDPVSVVRTVRHACHGIPMKLFGMTTQPLLASEESALRRAGVDGFLLKPFELDLDTLEALTEAYN